jgi:hypothetical protein
LKCETLIAHKTELDNLLSTVATASKAHYVVLGTADRQTFRRGLVGAVSIDDIRAHTSDFKSYWNVEITPAGWYPNTEPGNGPCSSY